MHSDVFAVISDVAARARPSSRDEAEGLRARDRSWELNQPGATPDPLLPPPWGRCPHLQSGLRVTYLAGGAEDSMRQTERQTTGVVGHPRAGRAGCLIQPHPSPCGQWASPRSASSEGRDQKVIPLSGKHLV